MAVYLKSGCSDNATTGSDCATLMSEMPVLQGWSDPAAEGPMPFIVLGNFNRQFNVPHDQVWAEVDDSEPARADLASLTHDMPDQLPGQHIAAISHIIESSAVIERRTPDHESQGLPQWRRCLHRLEAGRVHPQLPRVCPAAAAERNRGNG